LATGKLEKGNKTTWSSSKAHKMNATSATDAKVQHANATTWFENFPTVSQLGIMNDAKVND
jgi:hypothetical protein